MQHRLIDDGSSRDHGGSKTWAVILQTGDEVNACLVQLAREHHLAAAHLTAIGAFEHAVLGYFDWQRKDYQRIPVDQQCEVVALIGDVALKDDQPKLHMHVVLGLADGSTRGGHLLEATVRPTLEITVTETPAHLHRRHDPESGLALIQLDKDPP